MTNRPFRVALLCGNGFSSRVLYHALSQDWDIVSIILEENPSSLRLMARRLQRLGWRTVLGQVLFVLLNRLLAKRAQPRVHELLTTYGLSDDDLPSELIRHVPSANDQETIRLLNELQPDVVVVNGTRILSGEVLNSVPVPFLNIHMGITPRYRGVHGGYWALASDDAEHCGVTVHLVDRGIDTGGVLYQNTILVTGADNFNTYPVHQMATAIPLMRAALNEVRQGQVRIKPGVLPSQLWSHPTLGKYLLTWLRKGIK